MDFDGFMDVVSSKWNNAAFISDSGKQITAKFKNLRYGLKKWSKQLSNQTITNCSYTLTMLDGIEDQRQLSIIEKNFRFFLENHTRKLMEAKMIYWRNRTKIRWTKLGDENKKFFHTIATKNYRVTDTTKLVNKKERLIVEIATTTHNFVITWYRARKILFCATAIQEIPIPYIGHQMNFSV
jgi:hypothetical protein